MIGWSPGFNWTHDDFMHVMHMSFDVERRDAIRLDVEHSDRKNMNDIIRWAEELGYRAEEINCDTIRVIRV